MARVLNRHHNQQNAQVRTIRCKCPACKARRLTRMRHRHRTSRCPECRCRTSRYRNNRSGSNRRPANRCRECRCRKILKQNSRLPILVRCTRWSICSSRRLNTIPHSNRRRRKSAQPKAENGKQGSTPTPLSGTKESRFAAVLNAVVSKVDLFNKTSFSEASSEQLDVSLSRNANRRKQNAESSCFAFRMLSQWPTINHWARKRLSRYGERCSSLPRMPWPLRGSCSMLGRPTSPMCCKRRWKLDKRRSRSSLRSSAGKCCGGPWLPSLVNLTCP